MTLRIDYHPVTFNKIDAANDKAFFDEIWGKFDAASKKHINPSFIELYKAFYKPLIIDHKTKEILAAIPSSTENEILRELEEININQQHSFTQHLIDAYTQCLHHGKKWSIDEFMENLAVFKCIDKQNKVWQQIRSYLTQYFETIHRPLHQTAFVIEQSDDDEEDEDDDDDDDVKDECIPIIQPCIKHNLWHILNYMAAIQPRLQHRRYLKELDINYKIDVMRQMDVIFVPCMIEAISPNYFQDLGINYVKLQKDEYIPALIRRFDKMLSRDTKSDSTRSVMLIMSKDQNNMDYDEVYLFQPLHHQKMPDFIHNYSELLLINYTKSDLLPTIHLKNYNALCLSFHVHSEHVERVYLSYMNMEGISYQTRIFAHNIIDILLPFCYHEGSQWSQCRKILQEVRFKDDIFYTFAATYFPELIKQNIIVFPLNDIIKLEKYPFYKHDYGRYQWISNTNIIKKMEETQQITDNTNYINKAMTESSISNEILMTIKQFCN